MIGIQLITSQGNLGSQAILVKTNEELQTDQLFNVNLFGGKASGKYVRFILLQNINIQNYMYLSIARQQQVNIYFIFII